MNKFLKLIYIYLFTLLILFSCSDKYTSNNFEKAAIHRENGDLMNSIKLLHGIVKNNRNEQDKQRAQFNIADIYMNDVKDYSFALDNFDKVLKYNIDNDIHKKSLFMFAYICSNYLDMYSDAYICYEKFIVKYPEDDLIASVKYEIEQLQPYIDTIKKLID